MLKVKLETETVPSETLSLLIGIVTLALGSLSNLTVNITPSSTSNKILVMTSSPVHIAEEPGTDAQGYLSLDRDSTSIATAIFGDHTGNAARADDWSQVSLLQLDAPSTTSQIAYNVKIKSGSSGWTAEHCTNNFPATIVCMEIKA